MRKFFYNKKLFRNPLKRKIAAVLASLVLMGGLFGVYFIFSAAGAPVDVLGGNGSLDTTTQVNAFTLVNTTGINTWALDTGNKYAGAGSGGLQSPKGNGISFDAYVYYRFTTNKLPQWATLDLAYKKTWGGAQPSTGSWNVTAEIWEVGGTAPLQTITIDNGNANVNFVAKPTQTLTAITKMNTQYELRLKQQGKTGANSNGQLTTWFDEVKLTVAYDDLAPVPEQAAAVTDTSVDVVFNEQVEKVSAEILANYSISPALTISAAALQPDGKTVRLTTARQVRGTSYTITVNGVKDISGNAMTTARNVVFTGIDSTPPVLSSAASVDNKTVHVVFNEEVDWLTAEKTTNYSIDPALSVSDATLQADKKTVHLVTSSQTGGTNYSVTVNGVEDISGNVISGNNTASFTGIQPADTTPPTVVSATGVDNTTVDVIFSEKLDAATAGDAANYAINPALAVSAAALQADGKTVRLTTSSQTGGVSYTVTVNKVKDTSGNTIGANNSAGFTGVAPPDTTPPTVVSAISVNNTTVDVEFSEPVDVDSAQAAANYAVSPALSVTGAAVRADGKTVRLTTEIQTGGTGYTITVTNVKDVSRNTVGSPNSAAFTGTAPDITPPAVVSATAISATRVDVVFSEEVEPLSAQQPANYSTNPTLAVSDAVLQPDGKTVRLTTALQAAGTAYNLTAVNIRDLAGNLIDPNKNTTAFSGSGLTIQSPHGSYMDDTNQCVKCHTTHNARGVSLITQQTVTNLCYLCHDAAGQSKFDVASQFGKTEPFAPSRHPVPDGGQQCTDCHNPHDGGKDSQGKNIHWPRLLQNKVDKSIHSGNQFCLDCHRTAQGGTPPVNAATFPAEGTAHNNSAFAINGIQPFNPASGTNIRCMGCHEKHGSGTGPLLRSNPNQDDTRADGNNKSFCYECHSGASADGRYKGKTVFDGAYSGHDQQASNKTNVNFPGVKDQAGQCANCHDPHGTVNGTSKVAMKSLRGVYNDGKTNYAAADFDLCFQCHNSTSKDKAYDVQSDYNDAAGGHRIKTAGGNLEVGSQLSCEACHDIHGSANGNKYGLKDSLGSNLGDGRNECLACHQDGKVVEGLTMSTPPASVNEHTGGTTRCLECHGKPHKINKGISAGGQDCLTCHKTTATAMKSTNGYHHLITSTAPDYTPDLGKTCLTCHVDHNKFNNQMAYNLKANYAESFLTTDTSAGQNTDFDASNGGLCLSCHKVRQLKTYTRADGSTATQPISISDFASSAHNYTVPSTFGDNTVFNANCSKCHNDTMTKDKQVSANKFSTHDSGYRSILSNFGDTALTDPMDEKFCFKCHSSAGDVYGTPMSAASKSVYDKYQSTGSKHDLTGGEPGTQAECVSCHGPHSVGKAKFDDGLSTSAISDPDNTLRPYTKADGDMATWCIKCHDSSPPVQTSTSTTYVPVTIQWPTAPITINGSGYNKEVFKQSTHYTKVGMQCNNCHENHGSSSYNLWLYGEDTAEGGICIRCHNGNPAYPGVTNILADLQKGTSNNYRHPTLDVTAGTKHNNKEDYQNRPLTERHAECSDCHDPHSETPNLPGTVAPAVPGPLRNISGVGVTYGTSSWSLATNYTFKNKIDYAYEICLKCHSYYSYGNNPPKPGTTNTTFDGRAQTDPSIEFNPNNASYHAVIGESKANTKVGAYVGTDRWGNPWTSTSRMYCEDCHGSDDLTREGPHGSSNKFILKRPYKPTTDTEAMNGTGADADSDQHLCFMCHDRQVYGSGADTYGVTKTGFSGGGRNLHNFGSGSGSGKHGGRSCNACHSMVVHGSRLPHLLIDARYDPFPYNNNGKNEFSGFNGTYDQTIINTINSKSGKWTQNDCTHNTCG